jgi:DNA-directed RNA polymerase specialized sigma24 family protein
MVVSLPVQRRLGPDELSKLVAAYREGVPVEELAASFGVNRTTVLGHVRRQGVPKRDRRR